MQTGQESHAASPTNALDAKILDVLGDRVILKPLTRWNEAYKEFPRYVMEYLVSRYTLIPLIPLPGSTKSTKFSLSTIPRAQRT